jgi:hypothetical protein
MYGVSWNPNSSTPEPDRRPAALLIAQQYSSTNFVPLRFHFRKNKFGADSKNIILIYFFNHA